MVQNSWMTTIRLIMDSALQWKNLYPLDNSIGLVRNTQLPVRTGRGAGEGVTGM